MNPVMAPLTTMAPPRHRQYLWQMVGLQLLLATTNARRSRRLSKCADGSNGLTQELYLEAVNADDPHLYANVTCIPSGAFFSYSVDDLDKEHNGCTKDSYIGQQILLTNLSLPNLVSIDNDAFVLTDDCSKSTKHTTLKVWFTGSFPSLRFMRGCAFVVGNRWTGHIEMTDLHSLQTLASHENEQAYVGYYTFIDKYSGKIEMSGPFHSWDPLDCGTRVGNSLIHTPGMVPLTKDLLDRGDQDAIAEVTCLRTEEFWGYAGSVTIINGLPKLKVIVSGPTLNNEGVNPAYVSSKTPMTGTFTLAGAFPKLQKIQGFVNPDHRDTLGHIIISPGDYYIFKDIGNSKSTINMTNLSSLERIPDTDLYSSRGKVVSVLGKVNMFEGFLGTLKFTGPFPRWASTDCGTRYGGSVIHAPAVHPLTRELVESGSKEAIAEVTCVQDSEFAAYNGCVNITSLKKLVAIGSKAFHKSECINITGAFPSLKEIGEGAFESTRASTIEMSGLDALEIVGISAFHNFDGRLTFISSSSKLRKLEMDAFWNAGNNMSNVELMNLTALEQIQSKSFQGYKGTIVVIGSFSSLEKIQSKAFFNAGNSESKIHMANLTGLEVVAADAFTHFSGSLKGTGPFRKYAGCDMTLVGPPSVVLLTEELYESGNQSAILMATCVANSTFANYKGNISLPQADRLTYIGNAAFKNVAGAVRITGSCSKLAVVGEDAFSNTGQQASSEVVFTNLRALRAIGENAFRDFEGTVKMTGYGDQLEVIGPYAFGTHSQHYPPRINSTFAMTTLLKLQTIGESAFENFKGMIKMEGSFPALMTIHDKAFFNACNGDSVLSFNCVAPKGLEVWQNSFVNSQPSQIVLPSGVVLPSDREFSPTHYYPSLSNSENIFPKACSCCDSCAGEYQTCISTTATTTTTTKTTTTVTTITSVTSTTATTTSTTRTTTTSTKTSTTTTIALCNGQPDPQDCKMYHPDTPYITGENHTCCLQATSGKRVWEECKALCHSCRNESSDIPGCNKDIPVTSTSTTVTTTTHTTTTHSATTHAKNDNPNDGSDNARQTITIAAAVGSSAMIFAIITGFVISTARKRRRYYNVSNEIDDGLQMDSLGHDSNTIDEDDPLIDFSGDTITIATATVESHTNSDGSETTTVCVATTGDKKVEKNRSPKFVATTIRLGSAGQAATGLADLMGVDDSTIGQFLQEKEHVIYKEFRDHGSDEDKRNLQGLLDGTYRNPGDSSLVGAAFAADAAKKAAIPCPSIDELMTRPEVLTAGLSWHHVLALRLYTTSSYMCLNNPLRTDPPTTPHPFAATTYFISEAIKKLRAVAAEKPDAFTPVTYWRGLRGMALSKKFVEQGGTEFGCMSTSASKDVAIEFSESKHPLVFKYATDNFMSRGADISFLSVYPEEKEALYPPLTYLSCIRVNVEHINGRKVLVASVKPTFPS